jgi:hypothetical protein
MNKERQARRVKSAYQALLVTEEGQEYSGTIDNISLTGMFLSCEHNMSESTIGSIGILYLVPVTPGLEKQVRTVRVLKDGIGLEPLISA